MRSNIGFAALMTLGVIAISQAICFAVWRDMPGGYDAGILVACTVIPIVTCFPISLVLLAQRRRLAESLAAHEAAHARLKDQASRDPMTGLLHRQAFFARIATSSGAGSFLMIDVDHFKAINDTCGHAAGDRALLLVAKAIAAVAREGDVVARFGGEEFCLFAPTGGGTNLAEQVRRAVGKVGFSPAGEDHRITVSIGVADAADHPSTEAAIAAADGALYEAKRGGRNRVSAARPAPPIICRDIA